MHVHTIVQVYSIRKHGAWAQAQIPGTVRAAGYTLQTQAMRVCMLHVYITERVRDSNFFNSYWTLKLQYFGYSDLS